jgi:lactoylglutathione lyase
MSIVRQRRPVGWNPGRGRDGGVANLTLRHMRLLATDFAKSYRFYRDLMGLTPKSGKEGDNFVFFTDGAQGGFELVDRSRLNEVYQNLGMATRGDSPAILVFETRHLHNDIRKLRDQGVEIASEPMDIVPLGVRKAHVRDPEGNLIELIEKLS